MIIKELVNELKISEKQINEVLKLLNEGATIPFIARYRKEQTGGLDEDKLRDIEEKHKYYTNLMERKETVIKLIDEKGMLTEELKSKILACKTSRRKKTFIFHLKKKRKPKQQMPSKWD